MSNIITAEREFRCLQTENYKFKNTSLFTSLKVKKIKNVVINIVINGVRFSHTNETNKFLIFDAEKIRRYCKESLGFDEHENNLIRLEETFKYNSLAAMSHYKSYPIDVFNKTIFSDELQINFDVSSKNLPSDIEVTENYIVSDIHKETYS
jgi:hypothetical protein